MSTASEIEAGIVARRSMLLEALRLIERREPLTNWPAPLRRVLVAALVNPRGTRAEAWKATALRRHLFGSTEPSGLEQWCQDLESMTHSEVATSEYLRADLAGLVPLRAGTCLLA